MIPPPLSLTSPDDPVHESEDVPVLHPDVDAGEVSVAARAEAALDHAQLDVPEGENFNIKKNSNSSLKKLLSTFLPGVVGAELVCEPNDGPAGVAEAGAVPAELVP